MSLLHSWDICIFPNSFSLVKKQTRLTMIMIRTTIITMTNGDDNNDGNNDNNDSNNSY